MYMQDKYIAVQLLSSSQAYVCNMKVDNGLGTPGQKLLTKLETYSLSYTPSAMVTHRATSCTAILLAKKVKDGQKERCMRSKKEMLEKMEGRKERRKEGKLD